MIELFDTHAHFEGSKEYTAEIVRRAHEAGVTRIMAVGGSDSANRGTEGFRYRALGFDREEVLKDLPRPDYTGATAVGEIGLDYACDPNTRKEQCELFGKQLELARELNLPVIIHTRGADEDTIGLLREIPSRGVIHCFTGSDKFCRELLDLGFYISISGIVTFKNAENVREVAVKIPDDRIVIETDSPFLAPVPMRGNKNEPSFIVHTAKFLAALRNIPFESFAKLTTRNGMSLFGIS